MPNSLAPKPLTLRAGELTVTFDRGTLRYIKLGQHELLRGIYAAVRDANWGTVPYRLEDVELRRTSNSFTLSFTSVHHKNGIHFVWRGKITGEPNKIAFSFDGEAKSAFERNRVGFCVLHPMSAAGAPCRVEHTDGQKTSGQFPETIAPHQPFKDVRSISHDLPNGSRVKVTMQGDRFEMEDQRNWTDASFKTYCTPLERPFPVKVEAGTRIKQRVILEVAVAPYESSSKGSHLTVTRASKPLPSLGLGAAYRPLKPVEIERLKALNLDHLRLDLDLRTPYLETLARVIAEVKQLGCKLELALHLSNEAEAELEDLARPLTELAPPLARVLIFHGHEKTTSAKWLELARRYFAGVPLAGGTDAFFTELNRERPALDALDLLSYSLNPQVHAFDDASLIETLPAQAVTVASAAAFSAGKPVIVSPVTFKMRNNPNATGDKRLSFEERTDARQRTLFGAVWTLGSLKYLLESSAASLTYFETAGKLGVMSDEGYVYPLFHVFADVGDFSGGSVVSSASNQPLSFEGLVLKKGRRERVLLANFSAEPQTLRLSGVTGSYRGRMLSGTGLEQATRDPEAFRSSFPLRFEFGEGSSLTLEPYALLTLDKTS